ncbi:MAG TPA: ShlB/FhaC/HecB family hemolysin secretion/activation protein [Pyrinomonadaceae bacterium]
MDKELSRGGFEPSDLFKCRAHLEGADRKRQTIEKELINDIDNALLKLPRFYLVALKNDEIRALTTYLPAAEREELIPLLMRIIARLPRAERVKFFRYLPPDERLPLILDLDGNQKKEFFAYLPSEVQAKVLEGLSEDEKAALGAKKQEDPPLTAAPANEAERLAVASYPGGKESRTTGAWGPFVERFRAWQATKSPSSQLVESLGTFLQSLKLADTPIIGYDSADPVQAEDAEIGRFSLRVTDPIGDPGVTDDYRIVVPAPLLDVTDARYLTPSREKIISLLTPLQGQLWRRQRIASYINDYFIRDRTGYERGALGDNALFISTAEVEPKCILIPPVPQITRIVFFGQIKDSEIVSALREILTDEQLKRYRANPQILTDCQDEIPPPPPEEGETPPPTEGGITIQCKQILFRNLVGDNGRLPFLNSQDWQLQQAALAQAGFSSVWKPFELPSEGEDDDCKIVSGIANIQISKASSAGESLLTPTPSPSPTPPAPTPSPDESLSTGLVAANDSPLSSGPAISPDSSAFGPAATPSPTPAGAGEPQKQPTVKKPRLNTITAEIVYRPDQGFHVAGGYIRKRPGDADFSITFGGDGGLLVDGEYAGLDLFRGHFERKFPFSVTGYTDSVANRLIDHVKLDERRTGAKFRVATNVSRNPTLLNLWFEGRHETVGLNKDSVIVDKQNVSSLSFGAIYETQSKGARFLREWHFEPSVRFGLGIGNQPSFWIGKINGSLRQRLPRRYDLIFSGRFDGASQNTPIFDQPSFGSSDTVGGFRADDAIGLRQWSLQNEFVMPAPGTAPDSTGLLKLVRESVRIAAFFDIGGIYQTTSSTPGMRFGPGAGARVTLRGIEFHMDWAYGLGDASTGRGRGRFYFSASPTIRGPRRQ